jgi:hypothetical protein
MKAKNDNFKLLSLLFLSFIHCAEKIHMINFSFVNPFGMNPHYALRNANSFRLLSEALEIGNNIKNLCSILETGSKLD